MKNIKKILSAILILGLLICTLTSCIEGERAKSTIEKFFNALAEEKYSIACTYFHPDVLESAMMDPAELLEGRFSGNLDLSNGYEIVRYSGFESTHYNPNVKGSVYTQFMEVKISEKTVHFTISIVENNNGFGIYDIEYDDD